MEFNECEGCASHGPAVRGCLQLGRYVPIEDISNCPCSECLVKTMCRWICEDYRARVREGVIRNET